MPPARLLSVRRRLGRVASGLGVVSSAWRRRLVPAVVLGVIVLICQVRAHTQELAGTLSEVPLPGGLRAALAVIDDPATPDRSQFLVEFIRRVYHAPIGPRNDPREAVLRSLLGHLDSMAQKNVDGSPETIPLPLTPAIWVNAVFGGKATPATLAAAILRSRDASLLYCGLLALDDPTRTWIATKPDLISDLASTHAAAFMTAAPGLRIAGGAVRVPGGEPAIPVWEALAGRRVSDPAAFIRTLSSHEEGRLAFFYGSMAALSPVQIRLVLNLDSTDQSGRVDAARRLYDVFARLSPGWKLSERSFWRPLIDPALLATELSADENGRPILPGTRQFWNTVLEDVDQRPSESAIKRTHEEVSAAKGGREPFDFSMLCEHVFKGDQLEQRRRYEAVLFASRLVRHITPDTLHDAVDAVRAAAGYPALITALERAKLTDVNVFAVAARRAAQLSSIPDDARATRALAQFQGALALITRAAVRGSLPGDAITTAVVSLCAVDVNDRGDYEGRLVEWIDAQLLGALKRSPAMTTRLTELDESAAGPVERDLLHLAAGADLAQPRFVDWEGTRYRINFPLAEATRLMGVLGEHPRPYLSSARTLVAVASALGDPRLTRDTLQREAHVVEKLAEAVWPDPSDRNSDAIEALQRIARDGDVHAAPRLAAGLRLVADDLLARGLLELAYATAIGQPERISITADEASSRHDFGLRSAVVRRTAPWRFPLAGTGVVEGWHVTGSVLGLDVALAELSLKRLSAKPPTKRPTLNDYDRRALIGGVALVDPASLTDSDRDTIVAAIQRGHTRLAALRTPSEAIALADEIHLSPTRQTLLPWVLEHDQRRLGAFLSSSELLLAGLEKMPVPTSLHAWGAPAEPRLGCLCLQILDRRPWEMLAGRWNSGIFVSSFPDLNLRLAELLTELRMPALLLAPVLESAALDFVDNANSRDQDDRRGLVEYVQGLRVDKLELYLALLTTEGPLVPTDSVEPIAKVPLARLEVLQ